MADVICRYRKGKIQLNVIKGEYQGKPTTSFTIQKRVLKNDKWTTSDFLTITDLQDILTLTSKVCDSYVKFEKVEPKPKEEVMEEPTEEEPPF